MYGNRPPKSLSGQIRRVLAFILHRASQFGIVHPKRNLMPFAAARKKNCQRRAPASAAQNCDPAHSASFSFLLNENFGSVPSTSLCRFASCLYTMSIAAASEQTVTEIGGAKCGEKKKKTYS